MLTRVEVTFSCSTTSKRYCGGSGLPPPVPSKIRSLRMRWPTRPGIGAKSTSFKRSLASTPLADGAYSGRKPESPHAAKAAPTTSMRQAPNAKCRRDADAQAGLLSSDDISDPLWHDDRSPLGLNSALTLGRK